MATAGYGCAREIASKRPFGTSRTNGERDQTLRRYRREGQCVGQIEDVRCPPTGKRCRAAQDTGSLGCLSDYEGSAEEGEVKGQIVKAAAD